MAQELAALDQALQEKDSQGAEGSHALRFSAPVDAAPAMAQTRQLAPLAPPWPGELAAE